MRRFLSLACLLGLVSVAPPASARRESTLRYPFSLVWTTAVRMVRVDYESPITEKDRDEGYFLFSFVHAGKEHPGSFEVIEDSKQGARVVVQIPAMPSYVEQMLLDKLERKLAKEHGDPREPKREPNREPNREPAPDAKPPAEEQPKAPDEEAPPSESPRDKGE